MTTQNDARKAEPANRDPREDGDLTHQQDYARNGDYLGRHPEDKAAEQQNHFDEEYMIDEHEPAAEHSPDSGQAPLQH